MVACARNAEQHVEDCADCLVQMKTRPVQYANQGVDGSRERVWGEHGRKRSDWLK